MNRLRVVVVDEHRLVLNAVRAALSSEKDVEIVGDTTFGLEAAELAAREDADLVLLDPHLPDVDGYELVEELAHTGELKVVVLADSDELDAARESLKRGASAFLSKHVGARELAVTLHRVAEGFVVTHDLEAADNRRERAARSFGLTRRETQILGELGSGRTNRQIAFQLGVTEQAVKYHVTNLYRKLDVENRVEALRVAEERGLLQQHVHAAA